MARENQKKTKQKQTKNNNKKQRKKVTCSWHKYATIDCRVHTQTTGSNSLQQLEVLYYLLYPMTTEHWATDLFGKEHSVHLKANHNGYKTGREAGECKGQCR